MPLSKTTNIAKQELTRVKHEIDAAGKPLGRVASEIAKLLIGKHKPTYAPHLDAGDSVFVRNAGRVALTGKKMQQKVHHHHTGYPGGLKTRSVKKMLENKPEEVIALAVKRMLPKNSLIAKRMKRLHFV